MYVLFFPSFCFFFLLLQKWKRSSIGRYLEVCISIFGSMLSYKNSYSPYVIQCNLRFLSGIPKTSNIKHQTYLRIINIDCILPKNKRKQDIKINKPTIQGEFILDYPSFGIPRLCTEIAKRAHRACQVLLQAPELRIVVVSWWDTTTTTTTMTSAAKADSRSSGGGEEWRSNVLAPLRMLVDGKKEKESSYSYSKRRLRFEVGSVNAAEEFGQEEFADALRGVVGEGMVEVRNLGK